jgi:hypothetical protein
MDLIDKIKITIGGILISPSLICIFALLFSIFRPTEFINWIEYVDSFYPSLFRLFFTPSSGLIFIGLSGITGAVLINSVKLKNKI